MEREVGGGIGMGNTCKTPSSCMTMIVGKNSEISNISFDSERKRVPYLIT